MRISDWSSDVCSSDLTAGVEVGRPAFASGLGSMAICVGSIAAVRPSVEVSGQFGLAQLGPDLAWSSPSKNCRQLGSTEPARSEEHTSELQSLMRISYTVFCVKQTKPLRVPRTD